MICSRYLLPALLAVAVVARPAAAHRLDEYLQATRIAIDVGRVDLEIDLTAGSALASQVFSWIDTDRDGEISVAEGEAYARQVLASVVLKVDGSAVRVECVDSSYPQFSAMSLGVGVIRLRAIAKAPGATSGRHQLSFLNTHRTESSVYLVNALVPANPRIQLADPRRDRAQLGLTMDYTIASDGPPARTLLLLMASLMTACFFLRRSRSLPRKPNRDREGAVLLIDISDAAKPSPERE